jgi:predicted CopG family antitoxin
MRSRTSNHVITKVISLSEDAYRRLKRRKGEGESFSDVVVRLTADERGISLLALSGSWSGGDMEKVSRPLAADRERSGQTHKGQMRVELH